MQCLFPIPGTSKCKEFLTVRLSGNSVYGQLLITDNRPFSHFDDEKILKAFINTKGKRAGKSGLGKGCER